MCARPLATLVKATYDKEQAKLKFQSLVEAYEVLKDPELRARFLRVRQRGTGRGNDAASRTASSGNTSIASMRRAGAWG